MVRSPGARAARVASLALLLVAPAGAARAAIAVHGPEEVRERWIVPTDDGPTLAYAGRRWSLVEDASDPAVSTLGDGAFHPMSVPEVESALRALGWAAERAEGHILVLPHPRRETLKSSCEGGTIFLSPGIREVHPAHVHSTVVHEVGHLLQRRLLPEGSAGWGEYLELRGLTTARFDETAPHRDRPREIFAEDFRILLGGDLARGPQENGDLSDPRDVPGLRAWLVAALSGAAPARGVATSPESFPNPFSAARAGALEIRFGVPGPGGPATADVFDLSGRRVSVLAGSAGADGGPIFLWDGRDLAGSRAASGFYFVRWRQNPAAGTARVQILR